MPEKRVAVLRDARQQSVDRLVDLGDALHGPLRPLEAYQFFRGAPIVAGVAGNQDRRIHEASEAQLAAEATLRFICDDLGDEPVSWLRVLPKAAIVDGELFLYHGTPASDTKYLLEDVSSGEPRVRREAEILELLGGVAEPVVLCGHSHLARIVRLSNGQIVVNPGSVGPILATPLMPLSRRTAAAGTLRSGE
jgi:predicted phosphodiesterase